MRKERGSENENDNNNGSKNDLKLNISIENVLIDVERLLNDLSKENHKDGIRLLEQCAKDVSCALLHASQTLQQQQQHTDENGIVALLIDISNSIQEYYIQSSLPPTTNNNTDTSNDDKYNHLKEIAKASVTIAKLLLGGIQTMTNTTTTTTKKEERSVVVYTSIFVWNVIKLQLLFLQCLWVQSIYILRAQVARRNNNVLHCMTELVGFTIQHTILHPIQTLSSIQDATSWILQQQHQYQQLQIMTSKLQHPHNNNNDNTHPNIEYVGGGVDSKNDKVHIVLL